MQQSPDAPPSSDTKLYCAIVYSSVQFYENMPSRPLCPRLPIFFSFFLVVVRYLSSSIWFSEWVIRTRVNIVSFAYLKCFQLLVCVCVCVCCNKTILSPLRKAYVWFFLMCVCTLDASIWLVARGLYRLLCIIIHFISHLCPTYMFVE